MKKLFAILMLATLMFNMGGYMLLFQYYIHEADQFANKQISKGFYKPSELVEIKIPVRMPYVHEQREYQAISGQIELSGNNYNYVAMRMTRDTMYVKCVPNYEKTRLVTENVISAKEVSDTPLQKKNHQTVKKSGIDSEFNFTIIHYLPYNVERAFSADFAAFAPKTLHTHLPLPAQPPEFKA